MKRRFLFLLTLAALAASLALLCPAVQAEEDAAREGTCGEHLTWTLDETGTLTIRGTGGMEDYGWAFEGGTEHPWDSLAVQSAVLEEGVTSVGAFAFDSCANLTQVSLPSTLKTIGADAFAFCERLETPTLPAKLTSIGDHAFWFCEAFKTITIPASVTDVGANPFPKCSNLTDILIEDGCTACRFTDGVLYSGDGKTLICYPTSRKNTSFTVPEGVTAIGEMAFFVEGQLKQVTLPEGVTRIGDSAFFAMMSLTRLDLPLSLDTIGQEGIAGCEALSDIWYAGVKSDWDKISVGSENDSLQKARKHFSDGTESLAVNASGICGKSEQSFVLDPFPRPDDDFSVNWADTATWTLDSLGTLHITGEGSLCETPLLSYPDLGYSIIPSPWWEYSDSIRRIVIDEGITFIRRNNFRDCPNLTDLVLPTSIKNIGIDTGAFANDNNLKDIWFRGTEDEWTATTARINSLAIFQATVHYEYDETKQPEPGVPEVPVPELSVPMVDNEARTMTLTASTDQPSSAIFAVFDVNGKLLKTDLVTLEAGETRELEFSPDGPKDSAALQGDIGGLDETALICKVFLLGQEGQAPLCEARTAVMD